MRGRCQKGGQPMLIYHMFARLYSQASEDRETPPALDLSIDQVISHSPTKQSRQQYVVDTYSSLLLGRNDLTSPVAPNFIRLLSSRGLFGSGFGAGMRLWGVGFQTPQFLCDSRSRLPSNNHKPYSQFKALKVFCLGNGASAEGHQILWKCI